MVEGPGCTLNGDRIRTRIIKGQNVREVRGSAVSGSLSKSPSTESSAGHCGLLSLVSCTYTGVETLGKELFVYFGAKALRVHFGMNGSMRINPAKRENKGGALAVLQLKLTKDLLCFYDSTVDVRNAGECQEKVKLFEDLDVCSSKFSFPRAVCEIQKQGSRMLCDVLLDQAVLPGVGNIIKNEALFDCGLHPTVQAGELTDKQTGHLVKMTRDFTLLFYKCRKNGSVLCKHYKVYKKQSCGQCGAQITVCRLGEHNRMTYFCPTCQKDKPQQVDGSKLPKRNSLIGWAYRTELQEHVVKSEEEHWSCEMCTLVNEPSEEKCDICRTPRPQVSATQANGSDGSVTDLIKYPCNNFAKSPPQVKINRKTSFGHTTLVLSDFGIKSEPNEQQDKWVSSPGMSISDKHNSTLNSSNKRRNSETEQWTAALNAMNMGPNSFSHQQKRQKINHTTQDCRNAINFPDGSPHINMTGGTASPSISIPLCTKHRHPCVLHVVKKNGENKGRPFYSCSLSRENQCEFFEWADLHFPFCKHEKRCVMRTVLKIGPNNGRNFYVCPFGKDKQCDYFEWANAAKD